MPRYEDDQALLSRLRAAQQIIIDCCNEAENKGLHVNGSFYRAEDGKWQLYITLARPIMSA